MWPPSPDAVQQDERHVAIFAPDLKLDQASWYGICAEAYRLTCSDRFVVLFEALTGLAERVPTVGEDGIEAALRIAEGL